MYRGPAVPSSDCRWFAPQRFEDDPWHPGRSHSCLGGMTQMSPVKTHPVSRDASDSMLSDVEGRLVLAGLARAGDVALSTWERLNQELPADRVARIAAIRGRLAHCQVNTA